jgi:hypothetical protein
MSDLADVIDLHLHAGPDIRPRKLDLLALARTAKAAGMRGFLAKSHHTITADLAQVVEQAAGGIRVFGGVTLNPAVGGLNPEAVRAALALGAKEVFMPTLHSAHQHRHEGKPGGLSIFCSDGTLRDEVKEILDLVAQADAILGTCHLSPDEILALVRAARRAGIRKALVSHPELALLALPVALQQELAAEGAFFERMHVHGNSVTDWVGLAAITRAVGVERTVLVTDLGAVQYPLDPVEGMRDFLEQFRAQGFTEAELDLMARRTPARLLGLESW